MELNTKIASDLTIWAKYAKYLKQHKRRETWREVVERCMNMHIKQYPKLKNIITKAFIDYVLPKKVLPSMRSLQFAGKPIVRNHSRMYNCGYHSASKISFFHHTMFLLLGGTGVGFSVQKRHISQLPPIKRPLKARKYLIQDSIEGWADAVKVLIKAYLFGSYLPRFDYDDIRKKGTPLKTAGGVAPGPAPLRECLTNLLGILENKPVGSQLTSVEICDLACHIAKAVKSGGIRRSAMICLFDIDDEAMVNYKSGNWHEDNPQRHLVNISAVAVRSEITKAKFDDLFVRIEKSGSGEPGIYWTNNPDLGANPCVEISLKDEQFCNLTTINFTTVSSQKDLEERAYYAAVIGTLQAGYTDFHYLGETWASNCDKEALLGVSVTGLADGNCYRTYRWEDAVERIKEANDMVAEAIGITPAARLTCIKPEGTSSLVLGSSSGIHARHSPYYIRRIRFGKDEAIAKHLLERHPEIVDKDSQNPNEIVVEIPLKSPDRSIYRTENPLHLLERVKFFHKHWVLPGHRSGENTHNVSCTVSIKPEEWRNIGNWMWENRTSYNGIAVFPYDGGNYIQAPFEEISKERYDKMTKSLRSIDITAIIETEDGTAMVAEPACAGGKCDI